MDSLRKPDTPLRDQYGDFGEKRSYTEEATHHSFPDAEGQQENTLLHRIVAKLAPLFCVGLLVWLVVLVILGR